MIDDEENRSYARSDGPIVHFIVGMLGLMLLPYFFSLFYLLLPIALVVGLIMKACKR